MKVKSPTLSLLKKLCLGLLLCSLIIGLGSPELLAQQPKDSLEADTEQEDKQANDLINPLEQPAEDPLAERTPFFDRKDEIDPAFFEAGIAYYKKIAGYELRDVETNHYIKKWTFPLRVGVHDSRRDPAANEACLDEMQSLVQQLNSLGVLPEITLYPDDEGPANVELAISNKAYLANMGFENMEEASAYYINWNSNPPYAIYAATIAVDYKQAAEEKLVENSYQRLLQILGFMNLAPDYEESIFNSQLSAIAEDHAAEATSAAANKETAAAADDTAKDKTTDDKPEENVPAVETTRRDSAPVTLSELDWLLLEMHYRPELKPGMDFDRAIEILENLYLGEADYDPADEPESPAEAETRKAIEKEAEAVAKLQEKWQKMGVEINPEGPRETFYERRKEIDPEFFELGLEYYEIVTGYGEFDSTYDGYVKKWQDPVKVYLEFKQEPIAAVSQTLDRVVMQLNSLELLPEISWTDEEDSDYNVHIVVSSLDDLFYSMKSAPKGNWGFFLYNWSQQPLYKINSATIGLANDVNRECHMIHLLQEEFIQSLGLINDGELYEDSIFNQAWGHIQYPGELDWLLIEMHYRPEITPGMPTEEALEILRELYLGDMESVNY